jgi:ABC-type phosphate transport system substrate-binding protein
MSLMKKTVLIALLITLLLIGCASDPAPEKPPTQTMITVSFSSSINEIAEERILLCQNKYPDLIIYSKPSTGIYLPDTPLELSLLWGTPDYLLSRINSDFDIVQISSEKAVVLVNAVNPIQYLSVQNLRDILSGAAQSWSEFGEGRTQGVIQVYVTPTGSDLRQILDSIYLPDSQVSTTAEILPSAAAVAEKISQNPAGIGLTQERFLSSSTRNVQIMTAPTGSHPVLAVIPDNANPAVIELVKCLSAPDFD